MIQNNVKVALQVAICVGTLLFGFTGLRADEQVNAFSKANTLAQNRIVKIYGAKVGRTPGYASGLIISSKGQILTANGSHLNGDRIRVVLPDGSSHLATADRRSRIDQLAVLSVPAKTDHFFDLSKPSTIFKGQWILAVSNLFKIADGSEPESLMLGIVALHTKLEAKRGNQAFPYEGEVILLDSITSNPGAPGGAVVDAHSGNLVGMIGPILESRSSGTKLNYAIPTNVLSDFVNNNPTVVVEHHKKSGDPYLGIKLFRLDGKRAPAYVDRIVKGSPAATAGIRPDDAILGIGDERTRTIQQYDQVSQNLTPGVAVELTVKRAEKLIQIEIVPSSKTQTP